MHIYAVKFNSQNPKAEAGFEFLALTMPPEATGEELPMTVKAFVLDRLTY